MDYLAFIFYICNIAYAFTAHTAGIGVLNLFVPYSFIWDSMSNLL